jgi:hypothetical protein
MMKCGPGIASEALAGPRQLAVRDLFGTDLSILTTLLDVPLANGTRKAAS